MARRRREDEHSKPAANAGNRRQPDCAAYQHGVFGGSPAGVFQQRDDRDAVKRRGANHGEL